MDRGRRTRTHSHRMAVARGGRSGAPRLGVADGPLRLEVALRDGYPDAEPQFP